MKEQYSHVILKMWYWNWDEGLVRKYYETLPSELKSLCGELISDRLVVKSKLLKSEMYL